MTEISAFKPDLSTSGAAAANSSLIKAAIDRVGALVGIMMISPLLLVVAVLIKLDSPGPALFTQPRHGRNGSVFTVYKFRSMTASASKEAFRQATSNDARVTRLGRFLRKSSIDELPQLLNVVRGEMSLVGPRPHPLRLDDQYKDLVPRYMERYAVRPGLTGLAQVSGHRGETPTVEAMAQRVACDLDYIANWSLWRDLAILMQTLWLSAGKAHGKR